MAQVWPVEEARSGRGQGHAPAAIPAINAAIAAAARRLAAEGTISLPGKGPAYV